MYKTLGEEIFHICWKAEQRCKQTVSGTYAWSPKLLQAINLLAY